MTKKLIKGYVYRIKPTSSQQTQFEKTFGCVRKMYNELLNDIQKGKNRTIPEIKELYPYMYECDSQGYTTEWKHLQQAFKNYKNKTHKKPKFKKKYDLVHAYTTHTTNNNIRINEKKLKLPKIGWVKIILHRDLPKNAIIKAATIKREASEYYVSLRVEYSQTVNESNKFFETIIGLDYSPSNLYVNHQGDSPEYVKKYIEEMKVLEKRLKYESKKLSRKTQGSNRWNIQKQKIQKIYKKQHNKRNDFLHKESRKIVNSYDTVSIEDLSLKSMGKKLEKKPENINNDFTEMSKAKHRRKSMFRIAYGNFINMLAYKLEDSEKTLIKVGRYYPSSKTCHACGNIKDIPIHIRTYQCECGHVLDRDQNAALNIIDEGLSIRQKQVTRYYEMKWVSA